jgi:hypothetical protein
MAAAPAAGLSPVAGPRDNRPASAAPPVPPAAAASRAPTRDAPY